MEEDEEGRSYETGKVPGKKDVYDNFDCGRKKAGIKGWKAKFAKKNYAFREADVSKEASWLKVVYSFNCNFQSLLLDKFFADARW